LKKNVEKDELYEMKAVVMQALAHPIRLKIVDFLAGGEKCVCEIVEIVAGERTNISKHLSILQKADILSSRKAGLKVFYKVNMCCVSNFLSCAEEIIKYHLEKRMKMINSKH